MTHTGTKPTDVRSAELAELVEKLSARLEAGEEINWDEVEREFPQHAAAARVLLPTLQRLAELSRASGTTAPNGEPLPLGELGDYRIIREIGRGGMGVVYEAEQISLSRRVALKVLPFAAVMDPRHLQRFKNEARAAASLDHPNVVKVYGVGCERGVHFIALQFVDGRSMADLIRERRGTPIPGPVGDPNATRTYAADVTDRHPTISHPEATGPRTPLDASFIRQATEWGIRAAEALEHAHSLGIVHRDVKPGNLLIDGRGEVFVADFGLAKVSTDPGVTGAGDMLGTLRYMSPEQAGAQHDLVDHRSDVYSLGVTLYELLTLIPAFPGENREVLLSKITKSDPISPRKIDRRILPDLETVILKATEKDPSRRYLTAKELADDLRRVLEQKPVAAKRAGFSHKLMKWGRRNRAAVWSGVALLGIMTGMSAAATFIVWRQKEAKDQALRDKTDALADKEAALGQARNQRARAAANLDEALNAMTDLLWQLERKDLADVPRINEIRRSLALQIQRSYERFVKEESTDPAVRFESARAYLSLGILHEMQGNLEEGKRARQKAVSLCGALTVDYPEEPVYWKLLGHSSHYLALQLEDEGSVGPATIAYRESLRAFEESIRLEPQSDRGPNNVACLLLRTNIAGVRNTQKAVEYAKKGVQLDPRSEHNWHTLGMAHYYDGEFSLAVTALDKSLEHISEDRSLMAHCWLTLAMAHSRLGNKPEARRLYDQARDWIDLHGYGRQVELLRLRTEAEAVLGIKESPREHP